MKKLFSKIIAILVVLSMVFPAISCNNSSNSSSTNAPQWTNPTLSDPNEDAEI